MSLITASITIREEVIKEEDVAARIRYLLDSGFTKIEIDGCRIETVCKACGEPIYVGEHFAMQDIEGKTEHLVGAKYDQYSDFLCGLCACICQSEIQSEL